MSLIRALSRWFLAGALALCVLPLRAVDLSSAPARHARVPDAELVDQDGRGVRLYSDLIKGRVVALSFIFTSCPTACPMIGVTLDKLRKELGASLDHDMALVSISIDPANDTPEKMKEWGAKFDAGNGWTLLTGEKVQIVQLLKKLESYSPNILEHSPFLLIVDDHTGEWQRVSALETSPHDIAMLMLEKMRTSRVEVPATHASAETVSPSTETAAHHYFTDVQLTNQDGKRLRLYSDLLQGNIVIVDSFFSSCTGVCKVTMPLFQSLQQKYGTKAGQRLHLISISVDPDNDTPEKIKRYAEGLKAQPNWDFLTGDRASVELALRKFGLQTDSKDGHSNVFLIGNERTGLWKKVFGLGAPEEIAAAVESVLEDQR
jgi:cytochrome oxidase Cu insertion factor (SCO1/SenC/PrrC family)